MNLKYLGLIAVASVASLQGASPMSPEKYELLNGEGLAGSAFIVSHENTMVAVMSRHQFDGKVPKKIESDAGVVVLLDSAKVFKQDDVQALPVKLFAGSLPFLKYQPDFELRAKEEVAILGPSGDFVPGVLTDGALDQGVYKSADGPRVLAVDTSKPFLAAGGSGGPIIQKSTGAVVGVLLEADDPQNARYVKFETLCLPKGGVSPRTTAGNPGTDLEAVVKRRILPPEAWQLRAGMKLDELFVIFPKLDRNFLPGLRGRENLQRFPKRYLFDIVGFNAVDDKVTGLGWIGGSSTSSPQDLVDTVRWLISVYGMPQRAFHRDLDPKDPRTELMAFLWVKPDMLVGCTFFTGGKGHFSAQLNYWVPSRSVEDFLYTKGARDLPLNQDQMMQTLASWSRTVVHP